MSLLTVCIPTYKRLSLLRTLLEGLLPQAQALGVAVLVNDNCSGDGTAEYLAVMAERFACLSFAVNPATVPIDENMFLAVRRAEGRYVYPLGDDDFLPDGALAAILAGLSGDPDLLVLSAWVADVRLNPRRNLLPDGLRGGTYDDPLPAFRLLWDRMPFGSFVARRGLVGEDAFRKYFGTSHAYTGTVWEKLADVFATSGRVDVRCMETPTVILRGGEKSWKDYKARIYLYEIPTWFGLLPPLYAKETAPIMEKYLKTQGALLSLLAYRRSGQLTSANCREYMAHFGEAERRRAALVARLPRAAASVLRFFVKKCGP